MSLGGLWRAVRAGVVLFALSCDSSQTPDLIGTCGDTGQAECDGRCVDLVSNNLHCGACGNACDPGSACSAGSCVVACPPGTQECNGACVDVETDMNNCGTCRNLCNPDDEVCRAGTCELRCDDQLNSPVEDSWGNLWDGLERAASTWEEAEATCGVLRSRLPTATELFRVGATQTASVGQTVHTNDLWSIVPVTGTQHVSVRLSDGRVSNTNDTSTLNYRCMCPSTPPSTFSESHCHGPPSSECVELASASGTLNLDAIDRPAMAKSSATWECAFDHGHVARFDTLVETIVLGLGNGSNEWLHTADDSRHDGTTVLRWLGDGATWTYGGNVSFSNAATVRNFRCAGYSARGTISFQSGTFGGPTSRYRFDDADRTAGTWIDAHMECWNAGGHLARSAELAEGIGQGLPGGSGTRVWTADQLGFASGNFLAATLLWNEVDRRFAYRNDGSGAPPMIWRFKVETLPYRCIHYPVDTAFSGPGDETCEGGCFSVASVTTAAVSWFDSADRAAATAEQAFRTCAALGGSVASERDYIEAINAGLPGGSGEFVYSSDIGRGGSDNMNVQGVLWTDVQTGFTDQYPAEMTWSGAGNAHPFRCHWTNEQR